MIKVKIKRLLESFGTYNADQGAIRKLGADDGSPVKTLFTVRKVIKACATELELYDDTRMSLLDRYAKKDELGARVTDKKGTVVFADDAAAFEFSKAHHELLETEVELDVPFLTAASFEPRKITAQPFLNANDLLSLDWLILDEPTM